MCEYCPEIHSLRGGVWASRFVKGGLDFCEPWEPRGFRTRALRYSSWAPSPQFCLMGYFWRGLHSVSGTSAGSWGCGSYKPVTDSRDGALASGSHSPTPTLYVTDRRALACALCACALALSPPAQASFWPVARGLRPWAGVAKTCLLKFGPYDSSQFPPGGAGAHPG